MTRELDDQLERELQQKGKTAPRITGAHVDACIVGKAFSRIPDTLATHCVLALYNGWTIHATNAGPVSAENFDPEVGERLAFEAARDKVWQLEGYLLADRLHRAAGGEPVPAYGEGAADAMLLAHRDSLRAQLGVAEGLLEADGWILGEGGNWTREPKADDGGDAAWEAGVQRALEKLVAMDLHDAAATISAEMGVYFERPGPDGKTFSEAVAEVPLATGPADADDHPGGTPVNQQTGD